MRKTWPHVALASFMAVAPVHADTPKPDHKPTHCEGTPVQAGKASVYAETFDGQETANGEIFSLDALTAAHRTFEFGTRVRVEDQKTHKSVIVRINDRGPHVAGRVIDLSHAGRNALGRKENGLYPVKLYLCP